MRLMWLGGRLGAKPNCTGPQKANLMAEQKLKR